MNVKFIVAYNFTKRFVVPVLLGAFVGWLANHGYNNWIPVVCDSANVAGIIIEECK